MNMGENKLNDKKINFKIFGRSKGALELILQLY